ncbi:hypothetical protein A2U01_0049979, partial [Trifolium medium]|nr:hypothetical protein [Trifolium medium]
ITKLESVEAELEKTVKERDALIVEVGALKEKISQQEEELRRATTITEEEKKADPAGVYMGFDRATLVAKIFEVEGSMLETANSQFHNVVAQLWVLNPGLVVDGLDEDKEVCDGRIATPPPEEEA